MDFVGQLSFDGFCISGTFHGLYPLLPHVVASEGLMYSGVVNETHYGIGMLAFASQGLETVISVPVGIYRTNGITV
jgi:sorbitol-specific phosphotransferase system component IIC